PFATGRRARPRGCAAAMPSLCSSPGRSLRLPCSSQSSIFWRRSLARRSWSMSSSMPRKHLSLLLLAVGLAGCAGTNETPPSAPLATVDAPAPTSQPRKPSAIRASRPDELMGQNPQGLRALMGAPSLLRHDHDAEVWQYAGKSCVLFAYLYP